MVRNIDTNNTKQFFLNPLVHVILFILFIIIILAIFRVSKPEFSAGIEAKAHIGGLKGGFELEAFDNSNSKPVFVMYYAEWCGHCKRTLPIFNKLIEEHPQGVEVMKIDAEDPSNKELLKKQNVQGFPTIRYYPSGLNGEYKDYEGERTHGGFMNYLKQIKL